MAPPQRSFEAQAFFEAVYTTVQKIPHGKVTCYGVIASLVGKPECPRQVGTALKYLPLAQDAPNALFHGDNVPWQRVINARGMVSPRGYPGGADRQATVLRAEGVPMVRTSEGWALDDQQYWWDPPEELDSSDDEVKSEDED